MSGMANVDSQTTSFHPNSPSLKSHSSFSTPQRIHVQVVHSLVVISRGSSRTAQSNATSPAFTAVGQINNSNHSLSEVGDAKNLHLLKVPITPFSKQRPNIKTIQNEFHVMNTPFDHNYQNRMVNLQYHFPQKRRGSLAQELVSLPSIDITKKDYAKRPRTTSPKRSSRTNHHNSPSNRFSRVHLDRLSTHSLPSPPIRDLGRGRAHLDGLNRVARRLQFHNSLDLTEDSNSDESCDQRQDSEYVQDFVGKVARSINSRYPSGVT